MLVSEFDYHLPAELIARVPSSQRGASRLMRLDRHSGAIGHDVFGNIAACLDPTDLLVMNDTRVIPARLAGHKATGGKVEVFLLRCDEGLAESWTCLIRPSRGIREGQEIFFASGMRARVCERPDPESWRIEFQGEEPFGDWLEREGRIPLPPYLQREADHLDRERYQTVFAQAPGAVAAPTAGLHFSRELLRELSDHGIRTAFVTLHTGLGTFLPVRCERVEDHRIHTEQYSIPQATADAIHATRERGGRVVAVGTTTARTLEYAADDAGEVRAGAGEADIFIYPGYRFKAVDALVTNFHLPESTLLMLVAAFAGREFVLAGYREAIEQGYRFYSYGDAMLIT
jgi:S-adenosylmethionine:tRNA ribosyltransferase-isomerase